MAGGAITKVGGSLAKAAGINAFLAVLTKLNLPAAVVKQLVLDKVIDVVLDQINSTPAEAKLELRRKELFNGYGSRLIALDPGCQYITVTCLAFPIGFGRRFTNTSDIPGLPAPAGTFEQARATGLPNQIEPLGAVAFGAVPTYKEPNGFPGLPDSTVTGAPYLLAESPWYWQSQGFTVPVVSKGELATLALVYAVPWVQYSVMEYYPVADTAPTTAGNGNAPDNQAPYLDIQFDFDGAGDGIGGAFG